MVDLDTLKNSIDICKQKIDNALKSSNRNDNVILIGATKTQPKELIQMINDNALLTDVGENHVQEIVEKFESGPNLKWHMIGQLQSNKVKYIIDKVCLIHSLDRISLAKEIEKQASKRGIVMDCLVEINMGNEISKGGINKEDLFNFIEQIKEFKSIRLRGLMSVLPNLEDKNKLIDLYAELKDLHTQVLKYDQNMDILSSGMTNDYDIAVEYGASTMVRLGRVLFGNRN